eukprot:jgi/Mesen1/7801/ME000408S06913
MPSRSIMTEQPKRPRVREDEDDDDERASKHPCGREPSSATKNALFGVTQTFEKDIPRANNTDEGSRSGGGQVLPSARRDASPRFTVAGGLSSLLNREINASAQHQASRGRDPGAGNGRNSPSSKQGDKPSGEDAGQPASRAGGSDRDSGASGSTPSQHGAEGANGSRRAVDAGERSEGAPCPPGPGPKTGVAAHWADAEPRGGQRPGGSAFNEERSRHSQQQEEKERRHDSGYARSGHAEMAASSQPSEDERNGESGRGPPPRWGQSRGQGPLLSESGSYRWDRDSWQASAAARPAGVDAGAGAGPGGGDARGSSAGGSVRGEGASSLGVGVSGSASVSLSLADIVGGPVDAVAERLRAAPAGELEAYRDATRALISGGEGAGGETPEQLLVLQALLARRQGELLGGNGGADVARRAHRLQLQVWVGVQTGIPAFLHPDICLAPEALAEILAHARCRNIACQSQLPADGCACEVCRAPAKAGFCCRCMCVVCCKFDFDANTCRWIGCDFCAHWCHTDGGVSASTEVQFKCTACHHTSELLGFVKDVFTLFAAHWDAPVLLRELDCVRRIFRGSTDARGQRLAWKAQALSQQLEAGRPGGEVCKEMQHFFAEFEKLPEPELPAEPRQDPAQAQARGGAGAGRAPGCELWGVVREAVAKLEADAEEKAEDLRKAQLALELYDRDLEEKRGEVAGLQRERQQKKGEIGELERIIRLKQAEASIFQLRAEEARREADALLRIAAAKAEKIDEEYSMRYIHVRLDEAEAKRQVLQESVDAMRQAKQQLEATKAEMLRNIQQLLTKVDS